jgi:DNA-binding response OmpR family regulator
MVLRRPICLFVWRGYPHQKVLVESFRLEGFDVLTAASSEEFLQHVQNTACFLVFVDVNERPELLELIRRMPAKAKSFFWVAVSRRLSTQQSSKFFQMGASDILNVPVHPVTFRSRARMLLIRYLRQHELPADVVLPAGVAAHKVLQQARVDRVDVSGLETFTPERRAVIEKTIAAFTPRGRWFGRIDDEALRQGLMRFAHHSKAEALLWSSGRKFRIRGAVSSYDRIFNLLSFEFPNESLSPEIFEKMSVECEGQGVFCNLRLGPGSLFLRAAYRWEKGNLLLDLQTALYEIQRRFAIRSSWAVPERVHAEFEIGGQRLKCRLRDASAAGLGIELDALHFGRLKLGETCLFRFEIDGKIYNAETRLRWRRLAKDKAADVLRAGFVMLQPDEAVRSLLGSWSLEHLAQAAGASFIESP